LTADSSGICTNCGIALAGVGSCAVRAYAAEQRLKGERLSDSVFREVADAIPDELDPTSDLHASAEYRRKVAGVIVRRGLETAAQRVRKS
jgi:carbon-monoxide dehydrogenase medium subunit